MSGVEYLWTSKELLDPKVGAVEIGKLEGGKFEDVRTRMLAEAKKHGIDTPKMIVDLIFLPEKFSQLGSSGSPYPITPDEWESFVRDIPEYCGTNIPKVYLVDGKKFTAPI